MYSHRPVLLDEALAGLAIRPDGIYVDGTFGRGGHSGAILEQLSDAGALHALDRDPEAGQHAWKVFTGKTNFHFHAANFADLGRVALEAGIAGHIDGILLDLGVSSPQFDDAARGFSFQNDGPLDMRMDPSSGVSAADWLARADEAEIADVLYTLGEERNSRRIAKKIVESRVAAPLKTTAQLAALIASVPGPRSFKIHPATRAFQALRIYVNGELSALESVLAAAPALLAPGGRLAVISFHSLEDRIVKRFLRDAEGTERDVLTGQRLNSDGAPQLKRVERRFPTEAETDANPRARSAVLRVAERTAGVVQ
ncbi:16S rRNA (cytosine(1402)-N(4))-methyltransferase RsmH [Nevskia ramosa]|uniref:16S rRNA (cytosine(1402)-N(4))-methyltransferase RsmH n=1 Tax=Nevskia ramosa TaxID=64002 RepID=UPI002353B5E5|nr:16S rRNA (cytosine(1402)-N(4))-methyltransferase RsmH [Nevskia ramosa]